MPRVYLFICLSVGLSAGLRKKLQGDLAERLDLAQLRGD